MVMKMYYIFIFTWLFFVLKMLGREVPDPKKIKFTNSRFEVFRIMGNHSYSTMQCYQIKSGEKHATTTIFNNFQQWNGWKKGNTGRVFLPFFFLTLWMKRRKRKREKTGHEFPFVHTFSLLKCWNELRGRQKLWRQQSKYHFNNREMW